MAHVDYPDCPVFIAHNDSANPTASTADVESGVAQAKAYADTLDNTNKQWTLEHFQQKGD